MDNNRTSSEKSVEVLQKEDTHCGPLTETVAHEQQSARDASRLVRAMDLVDVR